MLAVEAAGLTKRYGDKTAVNSVSLNIEQGELFALLGVNGAGKTTTIRMLSCLSKPSSGFAKILGFDVISQPRKVKTLIGISPQDTAVAENLSVIENLKTICGIYGLTKKEAELQISSMLLNFGLDEVKNSPAKSLSGGWKRKLSIAMALAIKPEVLFLDEPTLGLDVLARRELWNSIKKLKGKITIILTTHYMEEAEALSDRIAIMLKGKIAAVGTLANLEELSGQKGLENAFVKIAEGGGLA